MINLELVGGAELVSKLDRLPARLREELKTGFGRLTLKLARYVQQDKLSGQVLNKRTGRLVRSIRNLVEDEGMRVTGIVSTPVKYARAHEYGFKGTVSVREHLREVRQAFGRSITPKQITVRAHDMKMNLPERSFLRSALRDFEANGIVRTEIGEAIARSIS